MKKINSQAFVGLLCLLCSVVGISTINSLFKFLSLSYQVLLLLFLDSFRKFLWRSLFMSEMANAALVSLAQTIEQILNDHQYFVSPHEKQQIICIHEFVIFLQAFLEDFPEKASSLEERISDVATEAEDIIEYFMYEQICGLSKSTVEPSKFMVEHNGRRRLCGEKVMQKIESIAEEAMNIKNSFKIKEVLPIRDFSAATSSSVLALSGENDMVGFSDDLLAIKGRLCGESSKLQIIPIVGMGGIGKTTLARNAYEDPLTMQYFDIRIWVTITQDYTAQEILSNLSAFIKLSDAEGSKQSDESILAQNVYKNLKGMRYLVVMDDMWSTKAWNDIKMVFPDDHNGSRIMLTTRLSNVAAYPDANSPLHEMRFMDENQSWDLLRQKVFKHEDCPSELEDIGKEIARSCRGLPLAIVVIAGLLSTMSKTQVSWRKIVENVNSFVATKDGQLEKILSLSYTHLPHHLRPYFLYMGSFPEDYEIRVSRLIKLWLAEGFSKPNESRSFEESVEERLEDLVQRSLVLVTERKCNGKIKRCSIHDLVRDLCIRKAKEEKFLLHVMDRDIDKILPKTTDQRRISVARSHLYCSEDTRGSTTRTIICFQGGDISLDYLNCRLLRVFDVVDSHNDSLSPQVFELFHLRYLAFQYPIKVPAAISNLRNLQTLVISPWRETTLPRVVLPEEIWKMPQLRHIKFFGHLSNPQGATSSLENLQTLSSPIDLKCTKRILEMIPNIKKLVLLFFEDQQCYLSNLVYLHQLENLTLQNFTRRKLRVAFPRTLKKLTLISWRRPWKDLTIVGSLPNLEELILTNSASEGDKWETIEGEFLQLKFLQLEASQLRHWITESSHFPRLKYLLLHCCRRLSEIPDGIAEIPTLELIEVEEGNKSLLDSAKRIQEEQRSFGNDSLQVRCMQHARSS